MNKFLSLLLKLQSQWRYVFLVSATVVTVGVPTAYFINKSRSDDGENDLPKTYVEQVLSEQDEKSSSTTNNPVYSFRASGRPADNIENKQKSNNNDESDEEDADDDDDDDSDDSTGINTPPVIMLTDTSFVSARYKFGQNVNISVRVIDNDLKYTRLFVNGAMVAEAIEKPVHTFILVRPALGVYEVQIQAIDKVNQSAKTPKYVFFVEVQGDIISPIVSTPLSNPLSIILSTPLSNGMSRPISETLSLISSAPLSEILSEIISNPVSQIISEVISLPISGIISEIVSNPLSNGISEVISTPLSEILSDIVSTPISEGVSNIVSNPLSETLSDGISNIISNPVSQIISEVISDPISDVIDIIISSPISEPISEILSLPISN